MKDKDTKLIWESFNEGRLPGEEEIPGHDDDDPIYDEIRGDEGSSTKNTEIAAATQALGRAVQALYNADLTAEDIMELASNVIPDAIKAFPRIYEPGKDKFDD